MRSCPGQLVVHRDGTVAYCTEVSAGRRCAGEDHPHRGGFLACRMVDGASCTCDSDVPVAEGPRRVAPATAATT